MQIVIPVDTTYIFQEKARGFAFHFIEQEENIRGTTSRRRDTHTHMTHTHDRASTTMHVYFLCVVLRMRVLSIATLDEPADNMSRTYLHFSKGYLMNLQIFFVIIMSLISVVFIDGFSRNLLG
jgi:hypothetical protein